MSTITCTSCHRPVKRHEAVQRGNGHRVLAYHRDCAGVTGVSAAPLTDRLARVVRSLAS